MAKKREEQEESVTWDLKKIYHAPDDWEKNYQEMLKKANSGWKEVLEGKGKLGESEKRVEKTLDTYFETTRELEKLYTYAHLNKDVDNSLLILLSDDEIRSFIDDNKIPIFDNNWKIIYN